MKILTKALNSKNGEIYLLIIEEINRANPAAVFGDIFQLLDRDEEGKSIFPISTSEDMQEYLEEVLTEGNTLGDKYDKIVIPKNMYIWATMNSADQGVFPMDTAFKRRWDFEYTGIDEGEEIIKEVNVELGGKTFKWNDLRKAINNKLTHDYHINEDKCLGPFFAFHEEKYKENGVSEEDFIDIFKNKIIMYLFEDAARSKRNDLFKRVKDKDDAGITLSDIYNKFYNKSNKKNMYLDIFPESIVKEVFKEDEQ